MASALVAHLETALPATLAVGGGNCLYLAGSCFHPDGELRRLAVAVDGTEHSLVAHSMPAPVPHGFWGFVPFEARAAPRRVALELAATLAGGEEGRHPLGELELLPAPERLPANAPAEAGAGPLVAVCMATFEPRPDLLRGQIASLREQTHRRWVCLVSDDCSSPEAFELLRAEIGEDPRFVLSRAPHRLGAYRNFERALSMVPASAELVALCDQDDRWYPEKLAALVEGIGEASLVYSDMRVLDESGRVTSDTFWSYKRNNYRNLASLLIDNTVTGAASLFRPAVLGAALPFPPPMESAHHDHWLAATALATGRIGYLDRPLYDYVQHPRTATPVHPSAERRPAAPGPRDRLAEGRLAYFKDLMRIVLWARVLSMRVEGIAPGAARRTLRRLSRLAGPREPVPWLLLRALRPLLGRTETLYSERSLLKAIAWRRTASRRARRDGAGDSAADS